jgi:hypothetical protein
MNKNNKLRLKLFLLLPLMYIYNLNAHDLIESNQHKENTNVSQFSEAVYVCKGSYAYAYHSRSDCQGLGNCKGDIMYYDENYAVNILNRLPCCLCWTNVSERCKDDSPSYNGTSSNNSDNSEYCGYAAIGAVAVIAAVGVAVLSNDLYVYPAYSPIASYPGIGVTFGFRKTFNHSALEYGASYISQKRSWDIWGGHLNFVHQVFFNKTPYWLKFYLGPTVNFVEHDRPTEPLGFGGIVGTEMKIFDRLKFDVRYENTTNTKRIQAGLIFTYQKEYFWNK